MKFVTHIKAKSLHIICKTFHIKCCLEIGGLRPSLTLLIHFSFFRFLFKNFKEAIRMPMFILNLPDRDFEKNNSLI